MSDDNSYIYNSKEDLVKQILDNDKDLNHNQLDEELIHELLSGKISKNINNLDDENSSLGINTDKIASFGGSWTFIISFVVVLFLWIAINTIILLKQPFGPLSVCISKFSFIMFSCYSSTNYHDVSK